MRVKQYHIELQLLSAIAGNINKVMNAEILADLDAMKMMMRVFATKPTPEINNSHIVEA